MHRIAFAIALACAAHAAAAQATVADDGSFSIVRDGARVGREDFSIRHVHTTAGAFETLTRGVIATGTHRMTVDLSTDSIGLPIRFQSKTVDDGRVSGSYRADVFGRRFSARMVRATGESARELMLPAGTLVVEDGVLHPLQFVAARGAGVVPAVVPSRGVIVSLTVVDAGEDHVSIALLTIPARKFVIREEGGEEREVWLDAGGRLLKVTVPSQHLVAIRDDAPRSAAR